MPTTLIREYHEEQKVKILPKEKEETKGFKLEEHDGVTFIRDTNFVLSRFL